MLTRLKLRLGEGELVEANLDIGRVYSQRRMAEETPLGLESQFMEGFKALQAMVEEMYLEFRKARGESPSTPKPDKEAEKPFLVASLEGKGKGEMSPPPTPPSSPSSSSSHKTSTEKKKKKTFLIKLDVKFDLLIYDGELNAEKLDNWIRKIDVYCGVQSINSDKSKI